MHRDILPGVRIVARTLRFHQTVKVALWMLRGAVEHHVFKEVRQPAGPWSLIATADSHPVVQRDMRVVVSGPENDLQPVAQGPLLHVCQTMHRIRHSKPGAKSPEQYRVWAADRGKRPSPKRKAPQTGESKGRHRGEHRGTLFAKVRGKPYETGKSNRYASAGFLL